MKKLIDELNEPCKNYYRNKHEYKDDCIEVKILNQFLELVKLTC